MKIDKIATIGIWSVTSLFLMLFFFNHGLSLGTDIAEHYQLVYDLQYYWQLPTTTILSSLPSSYIFAAIAGTVLSSPLAGMQFTILMSALIIWGAIAYTYATFPPRFYRLTSLLFLILFTLQFHRFDVFNSEIVGNYFFAQYIGEAIALLFFVMALSVEKNKIRHEAIYILISMGILFTETIHLLPAVILFTFLCLTMAVDNYLLRKKRVFIVSFFLTLIVFILLLKNPAFHAMRLISLNNGALGLHAIPNQSTLVLLAVSNAILSAFLMSRWLTIKEQNVRYQYLAIKYSALMGLSFALLCLLQILLMNMGEGSVYACRKYAFGLNTFLLINFSLAIGLLLNQSSSTDTINLRVYKIIFPSLLLLVIFFVGKLNIKPLFQVSSMVRLEQQIFLYKNLILEKASKNQSDYAVGIYDRGPPVFDWLFTRSILKAHHQQNLISVLNREPFSEPHEVRYLFSKAGSKWDKPSCRRHESTEFILLDGKCVFEQMRS